jgi:hypothetical protein
MYGYTPRGRAHGLATDGLSGRQLRRGHGLGKAVTVRAIFGQLANTPARPYPASLWLATPRHASSVDASERPRDH